METEEKQSQMFYELWAWAETNWRRLAGGAAAVAFIALVVSFIIWRQGVKAEAASQALSAVRPTAGADGSMVMPTAADYLKVAKDYPGSLAAARASLLAGSAHFEAGKYADAKAEFDKFLREFPQSNLRIEATYGQAACLDALNKPDEAIAAFKSLIDRYPTDPLAARAKVSLARQYKAKNQPAEALRLLEEVARTEQFGTTGLMAETLISEIKAANPNLATPAPAATNAVKTVQVPAAATVSTNKPK